MLVGVAHVAVFTNVLPGLTPSVHRRGGSMHL